MPYAMSPRMSFDCDGGCVITRRNIIRFSNAKRVTLKFTRSGFQKSSFCGTSIVGGRISMMGEGVGEGIDVISIESPSVKKKKSS